MLHFTVFKPLKQLGCRVGSARNGDTSRHRLQPGSSLSLGQTTPSQLGSNEQMKPEELRGAAPLPPAAEGLARQPCRIAPARQRVPAPGRGLRPPAQAGQSSTSPSATRSGSGTSVGLAARG